LRLRNLAKREVVDDLSATAGVGRVATPAKTLSSRMTLTGLPRSRECALRSRRLCTEPLHRGFVDPLQRGYVDQFVVGHGRASFRFAGFATTSFFSVAQRPRAVKEQARASYGRTPRRGDPRSPPSYSPNDHRAETHPSNVWARNGRAGLPVRKRRRVELRPLEAVA